MNSSTLCVFGVVYIIAEKTNVGVDDFDAVNSSTLCVFGVEPPSDATVPGPRVL